MKFKQIRGCRDLTSKKRADLMTDTAGNKWFCAELPVVDYLQILELQRQLVDARRNEIINRDIVLLLEHPPVFTMGRRGGLVNLKVSRTFLEKLNIAIIQTDRGGNITFHGPGQLVVYPIIDLQAAGMQVSDYVASLEEIMLRVLAGWGIPADSNPANRGIWIGNSKIGSIGIAVRQGVCYHGFALNVNLALNPFGWIHPCGFKDIGVTSMQRELSHNVSINQVRGAIKRTLESYFGVKLISTTLPELKFFINRPSLERPPALV